MTYLVPLRSTETIDLEAPKADSMSALIEQAKTLVPDRCELVHVSTEVVTVRSTATDEVTIENLEELSSRVPEGWQVTSIR